MILNDGALSLLNFETLIAPEPTPHYFIEDATLVSASSLDMLASAKPSERTGNNLLLFGDAVSPNPDYPDLPKAATEMEQIEQHFPARGSDCLCARTGNRRVLPHERAAAVCLHSLRGPWRRQPHRPAGLGNYPLPLNG